MAVLTNDYTQVKIIDDMFPVSVTDIDFFMSEVLQSYHPRLDEFLKTLNFSWTDYALSVNSRYLTSYVRMLVYRDKNLQAIKIKNFPEVFVPDTTTFDLTFGIIESRYLEKWKKIKNTLYEQYNIIKPYDMLTTEDESNKLTTKTDGTQTHAYTDSDNVTKDDEQSEDKIYGFNSTDGVKSDSNSTTHQMTSSGTDSGTKTNKLDYNSDRTVKRSVIRTGNTGNITSQEMIERELKLREYLLYQVIYKDLNEYLTLMVY